MPKRGKKYEEAAKLVEPGTVYDPAEALALAKQTDFTKFDATVELHLRTGLDPRHADQQVRGVVLLPKGTGKQVRILVFAEGEGERLAREAGADFVGSDDLVEKVNQGWLEFDVAIATPPMMRKVGRLGRVLGPRGLMPSPKAGTIVAEEDLPRVIQETRQGRVEYRVDKTANIHVPIGKTSFSPEDLTENMTAVMEAIVKARPAVLKGTYIRKVTVCSSMGPGIRVDPAAATAMKTV
ncbi:MAG: 50S ribosomal protein L1 [Anaerolineaceae bacterium]|nr:50S ribosomal protein L1 [Anaerolineaceae bacterium]